MCVCVARVCVCECVCVRVRVARRVYMSCRSGVLDMYDVNLKEVIHDVNPYKHIVISNCSITLYCM